MEAGDQTTRALVLAGGGVSGVAWELGILTALIRAGIDLKKAGLVVGTSAGSVVGAQFTSQSNLEEIFASQLTPPELSKERPVDFDINRFQQMIMEQVKEHGMNPQAIRAGIGRQALAAKTVPEAERKEIIAARLLYHEWPAKKFLVTAVDCENGAWKVFDRDSKVALVDAVAASCAVPLVWPPVTIDGRRYMDGGMRSGTNADLAVGYNRVLILVPMQQPDNIPPILGSNLHQEKAQLEKQGSRVMVVSGDETALKAMGMNVLDPANREGSARSGLAQGEKLAASVQDFWQG